MLLLGGSLMLASTATGRASPPLQHSFTGVIEDIDFTDRTITLKAEKVTSTMMELIVYPAIFYVWRSRRFHRVPAAELVLENTKVRKELV